MTVYEMSARQRRDNAYREGSSSAGLRASTQQPRPDIWLDCDGPLANILTPTLGLINQLTGRDLTPEQVSDWDLFACLGLNESVERALRAFWQAPGFCYGLAPTVGAKTAVAELQGFCNVRVATTLQPSAPTWAYDRLRWLAREFKIQSVDVVFIENKSQLIGDMLVDDKIEHVHKANMPSFLFDMPYNRHVPGGESTVERVMNWADVVKKARSIARTMRSAEIEENR